MKINRLLISGNDDGQANQTESDTDVKEENDALPNIEHNPIDFFYADDDDRFYWFDDTETITISSDEEPYDEPLYQNQEGDPAVQELMYQQSMALDD